MSVGFRPTEADNEIIRGHKRPGESTSDVLRRALRALEREQWKTDARADMERIAASGEDLSEEPDEWGFDEAGELVDLRGEQPRRFSDAPAESGADADRAVLRGSHRTADATEARLRAAARELASAGGQVQELPDAPLANLGTVDQTIHWLTDSTSTVYASPVAKVAETTVAAAARAAQTLTEGWGEMTAIERLVLVPAKQAEGQTEAQANRPTFTVKIGDRTTVPGLTTRRGSSRRLAHLRAVAARRGGRR
ncbi:hypothetical protein ACFY64_31620 [Streptomyces collinus]|uniref:hypothetical protein n=1 Tax=Streptomyces collinus TaxID=42684 RepID=UPI0036BD5725